MAATLESITLTAHFDCLLKTSISFLDHKFHYFTLLNYRVLSKSERRMIKMPGRFLIFF